MKALERMGWTMGEEVNDGRLSEMSVKCSVSSLL